MLPVAVRVAPRSSLRQRQRLPEIMDEPGLAPSAHERALRAIARINAWSLTAQALWRRTRRLMRDRHLQRLRILDLGCGDANVTIALARLARRAGAEIDFTACDRSEVAVSSAQKLATAHGIDRLKVFRADAVDDKLDGHYDVVISSLFLHHLDERETVKLLGKIPDICRHAMWMDDLCRSQRGYWLARWGCRLLTGSPVVRYDGPASVRSALTPGEALNLAARAGLSEARVARRWPERYTLVWERSVASGSTL